MGKSLKTICAVTRSQTSAKDNFKGIQPLIVLDIKIVSGDILRQEQKLDLTLAKYWKNTKTGDNERNSKSIQAS